jgi:hypothetical protein
MLRAAITVADNLTAVGQRRPGRQVMQPPDQGHHRIKRRVVPHPLRRRAAVADITGNVLQDLPAIVVHAYQLRASAELMACQETQKLMYVTGTVMSAAMHMRTDPDGRADDAAAQRCLFPTPRRQPHSPWPSRPAAGVLRLPERRAKAPERG